MAAIQSMSTKALLLQRGESYAMGVTREVVDTYLASVSTGTALDLAARQDRQGNGRLRCTSLEFRSGQDSSPVSHVCCGDDLEIIVGYTCTESLRNVVLSIGLYTLSGGPLCLLRNDLSGPEWSTLPLRGKLSCRVGRLPIGPGQYQVNLHCLANKTVVDAVQGAGTLSVEPGDFFGTGKLPHESNGVLLVDQDWSVY